jgi:lipid A 4'-phosphatase
MNMDAAQTPTDPTLAGGPTSHLTLIMLVSMLACAALFLLWPEIDLRTSAAFYTEGAGFSGERNAFVMALYRGIPMMSNAIIIGLFIALFAYMFQRGQQGARRRIQVGYLITALILGPGLLIDVVLKDHWGRARPVKVTEFGGAATFSPAIIPSDQCGRNCSFVSGHASAGFYFVSLGFLGGAVARRRWTLIGLGLGGIFGFGRIAQGGHFLSDVVFSFYATWFAAWLAWIIFRKLGWLTDPDHTGLARPD